MVPLLFVTFWQQLPLVLYTLSNFGPFPQPSTLLSSFVIVPGLNVFYPQAHANRDYYKKKQIAFHLAGNETLGVYITLQSVTSVHCNYISTPFNL